MKLDTWKWHKVTLSIQVQAMMTKNQCPTLTPKPLSFLDGENYLDHLPLVIAKPCPFFHRIFELTCDVKFLFCQNSYHSWCALSRFPTSTKCLFKGCEEEMHLDWWLLSRRKKPCVGEEAMLGKYWTTSTLGLFQFDGEFQLPSPQFDCCLCFVCYCYKITI